jgi:CRP-like cAMP-binding protein
MDQFDPVIKYVERYIQLREEEKQFFTSLLHITHVKRKQHVVQPDFTCKYRSYVVAGAMRAHLVDKNGNDHTIAFAIEDWWISDYNSYIYQQPATLFVEAVEDTILIQIDYNAEQLLMETHPGFERFFRIITQRSFASLQKRLLSNLSMTAEERYQDFANRYPLINSRFPQYAVASYLGFSTEFLSKIRNKRLKKLK